MLDKRFVRPGVFCAEVSNSRVSIVQKGMSGIL